MSMDEYDGPEAVAIIGLAGRFPGAASVAELWRNQLAGEAAITTFSEEELEAAGVPAAMRQLPNYVPARGIVDDPELFDAEFFGLNPREAEVMDPQNRLFLETCWQAIEDAGYDPKGYGGRAGVYAGSNLSTYLLQNLMTRPDVVEKVGQLQVRISNDKDSLATWVSYKLDLKGPAVAVQSACSTSLAAVHFGTQALLDGECDLAIAGGVALGFPHRAGYLYQEGGILSPDGRCRPFDAEAGGTVPGTGVGAVVLKRLSDALEDGDTIRAIVRAVAVTNDGALKAGYTAPGVEGQLRAVAEALSLAEVPARSVGYVETHGSGTHLGDPIEAEALKRAFQAETDERQFCALGALKAGIGHLDSAAGVSGLIKAVCALEAGKIPPMIHFERANPELGLDESPFYVPAEARGWPRPELGGETLPRRAGVSSFGIGGTNVHAVLEEAPGRPEPGPSRAWQPILLSARSENALHEQARNLAAHLRSAEGAAEDDALADTAHTLALGRHPFRRRAALVCRGTEEAAEILETWAGGEASPRLLAGEAPSEDTEPPGVAFLLPGLGDHHPGMTRELYRHEEVFRRALDECAELLRPHLGLDLREVIYPGGTEDAVEAETQPPSSTPDLRRLAMRGEETLSEDDERLADTRLAQPAVFAVEYALAKLLGSWGVEPRALIGYSLGEYVAATLAGVFPLDEALALVAERAKMIGELPAGAMLAVPLTEEEIRGRLEGADGLSVSAANGASLTVVGGAPAEVDAFAERLEGDGVACRRLRTTHAFHSAMMEPIRDAFARRVAECERHEPRIPFISNVTGTWIEPGEAVDPAYWARHLVEPVRFTQGVEHLLEGGGLALLEVGPGQGLVTLARQHPAFSARHLAAPALPDRRAGSSEQAQVLSALGRLWGAGVEVDWRGFYGAEKRRRVPLPTYPFEGHRFWVEPGTAAPGGLGGGAGTSSTGAEALSESKKADLADWFYLPGWQRSRPLGKAPAEIEGRWLVLGEGAGVGEALAEALRTRGAEVETAELGGYRELFDGFEKAGGLPERIVHLGLVDDETWTPALASERAGELLDRGFHGLIELAQALGERLLSGEIEIAVVSTHLQEVHGAETLCPPKAAVLGASQVISQEYPQLLCRSIDLEKTDGALTGLVFELTAGLGDGVVAHRGRHRWVSSLEKLRLGPAPAAPRLREGGAYLVSSVSATGLEVARALAERWRARPVLLAPPGAPGPEGWTSDVEPLVIEADILDPASVAAAVEKARETAGEIHGVFHTAGLGDAGLVQLKTREAAQKVLDPKIRGALNLAAAFQGSEPELWVSFSASAAILGGIGQVAHCGANAFLDAFALERAVRGLRTVALGWDSFRWESHDQPEAAPLPEEMARQLQHNLETFGIEAGEMAELLDRALGAELPRVVISGRHFRQVVAEFEKLKASELLSGLEGAAPAAHARPELATPFRAPETEIEEQLATMWRDAFGVDRVGVDDDFFELDGNSLMAIQIVTRLRTAFGVELPMSTLFDNPTIAQLGAEIEALMGEEAEAEEALEGVEDLLAEIEDLSPEEAELLLAAEDGS